MNFKFKIIIVIISSISIFISCKKSKDAVTTDLYPAVTAQFGGKIDLNNLYNYANQTVPGYILKNNNIGFAVENKKATLGRVLFFDKALSIDNSISCGSCHKQEFAFGDTALRSKGVVGGLTGRHSMRLVNTKFADEPRFFWDERAVNLADQTTRPIKDHAEMGFSGTAGRPAFADLLNKLNNINYYKELFLFAYGDNTINEQRIQESLTNFISSIQSFDSKFDIGRAAVPNDGQPFNNFTPAENNGKQLFLAPPQFNASGVRIGGGAGCNGCHNAPEFDISRGSRNNGVITSLTAATDLLNTRSPSLRDLVRSNGNTNGMFMHDGSKVSIMDVINHYNQISTVGNNNLDPRLQPGGIGQNLALTQNEKANLVAFLNTLSGNNIYNDIKWSSPF
jgi:cytochrome c peroxidase